MISFSIRRLKGWIVPALLTAGAWARAETAVPLVPADAGAVTLSSGTAEVSVSTDAVAVVESTAAAPSAWAPGWEALSRGDLREAERFAEKRIKADGPSAEAYVFQGHVALAQNDPGLARKRYRKALKLNPRYGPAYFGLGQVFEKKGRLDEAANEYRAASLADPGDMDARAALVRLKDQSSLPE